MIPPIKDIDPAIIDRALYSIENLYMVEHRMGQRDEPIIAFRIGEDEFIIYVNDSTLWQWKNRAHAVGNTLSAVVRQLVNHKLEYELQPKGAILAH